MSKSVADLLEEFDDFEYRHGYADDFNNTRLVAQIRALRVQRGWTQAELAERAGMKQARIHVIEDVNYGSWTVRTLARLAEAFDVALDVRFVSFADRAWDIEMFTIDGLKVHPYDGVDYANWSA